MKFEPVTKRDTKKKTTTKKFDEDIMSANFDVNVIFPILGQSGAIQKPDSRCIVCKTYIFKNTNLLFYKN